VRLVSRPVNVVIEPTDDCNSRCVMCRRHHRDDGAPRMPVGFMEPEVLSACAPLARLARSALIGGFGEPLLHPRFEYIAAWAKSRVPFVFFFTNGLLMTEDLAASLVRLEVDFVSFSLGGARAEIHRAVRGVSLDAALAGVRNLVEARDSRGASRPEVAFNVVQMNSVLGELNGIVDVAQASGITRIDMPQLWVEAPDVRDESVFLNPDAEGLLRDAAEYGKTRGVSLRVVDFPPSRSACRAPWTGIEVGYDGTCYSCASERYVVGHVLRDSSSAIWNGAGLRRLRRGLRSGSPSVCDGCPALACDEAAYLDPAVHGRELATEVPLPGESSGRSPRVMDQAV